MSTLLKSVLMLVIIAGGGWLSWYSGWLNMLGGPKTAAVVQTVHTGSTATSSAVVPQMNMNGMSDAKDVSNTAIQQDITSVDTQLQNLTTDNTSLDTALNDKPVVQAN